MRVNSELRGADTPTEAREDGAEKIIFEPGGGRAIESTESLVTSEEERYCRGILVRQFHKYFSVMSGVGGANNKLGRKKTTPRRSLISLRRKLLSSKKKVYKIDR